MSSISSFPNIASLFNPLSTSSSTSITTLNTLESSTLLSYFGAKTIVAATETAQTSATAWGDASTTKTSAQTPPWDQQQTTNQQALEAQVLSTTDFIKQSTTPLVGTSGSSKETQEDNQNLFTLYQAVSSLGTLAGIAGQSGATSGQLTGYNTRFQEGLQQVESFINSTTFNNFTLQTQNPTSSVTGTATVASPQFSVTGNTVVSDANLNNALSGVSSNDSFTVGVAKGGTTTNVEIDLSQIQGPLTLANIVNYTNSQLKADGFTSRLQTTITSGSINDAQDASWGISITPGAGESINLSSAQATPSLYLTGTTGSTTGTPANSSTGEAATQPDNQGNIISVGNLSGTPQSLGDTTVQPTTGNTTIQSSVEDSQGNLYVIGNATGNFGSQLNQASQDTYLTKYNSAGQVEWTQLLGSTGSSSGYSLALNPQGGVVVAGSSTEPLSTSSIADGNTDSFVASYDANGNQNWVQQIPTLSNNQANSVSVDSQGNVYIGGSVTGVLGSGQTNSGGSDAYLAQLNSSGQIVSENQFGTSGNDSVAATAMTSNGDLIVASQQNGEAIVSSYAGGTISGTPTWQMDLGSLNGGSIGGIAVSGNQIYLSGTTSNAALDAGGQATIASPSTGGTQAFVFNAIDNGSSGTANTVSYVGTSTGSTTGGGLTVGPDGTVYLAGTTTGTFAGQVRNVTGVNNAFVAALSSNGAIDWTNQYGGVDGQSTGTSVAIDPTGSSVLNALGLPEGNVSINQSVNLSSNTTLRAGDSFQLQIEGTAARTATITVGQGATLQTLVDQINSELLSSGKASINYTSTGEALEITASAGSTISLNSGPATSDALSRLGITAGVITAPAKSGSSSTGSTTSGSTSSSSSSTAKAVYGLSLDTLLDLSSSGDANVAKISLQNVLNSIQNIYQQTNDPSSSSSSTTSSQSSGSAPAYLTSQVANYNLALRLLNASSSSSSSSSTTTLA